MLGNYGCVITSWQPSPLRLSELNRWGLRGARRTASLSISSGVVRERLSLMVAPSIICYSFVNITVQWWSFCSTSATLERQRTVVEKTLEPVCCDILGVFFLNQVDSF